MRVIAGISRGIKLSAPTGLTTRPTSDRVKEAMFSILTSRLDFAGVRVLDICAGSGSLGIEALSRGAGHCLFIESNQSVKTILLRNVLVTHCSNRSEVITIDAVKGLQFLSKRETSIDLVLFDPPYDSGLYQPVLELLGSSGLLASEALIVTECSAKKPLLESYGGLIRTMRRVYGDTALELFTLEGK